MKLPEKLSGVFGKDDDSWPLSSRLKSYFLTGIATVFPVFVTVYVVIALFHFLDDITGKYINSLLDDALGFKIPGLGLILSALIVILAGFLSRNWIGRWLFPTIDHVLKKAPVFTSVYPSAKQLSEFLFSAEKEKKFKEVVLVEYPDTHSYGFGFVTNERMQKLDEGAGANLVSVFVPFAPAPFSGLILLVTRQKIKPVDIPVDQAIKFIVSGGIVPPVNQQTPPPANQKTQTGE
ncbi:MAG: DUF502 domain-containing protein [Chitinivibrionales bacterium]|nr:DUF502 domain-containing protein [Chitinivibrionales bacterium]